MKAIVVYPQFYGIGGIARYLDSFLSNLPQGHEQVLLVTGPRVGQLKDYGGARIVHLPMNSGRAGLISWTRRMQKVVEKNLRGRDDGIVNVHLPPLIPGLMISAKAPLVVTAHSTYLGKAARFRGDSQADSESSAGLLALKAWAQGLTFRRADRIIVLTEQAKTEVAEYGLKTPVEVIPNGVDLTNFGPGNTGNRDIDLLFCGRIERAKGSRSMVDVCLRVVSKMPDVKICIVGYGEDEEYVQHAMSIASNNVTLTGKVPMAEAPAYYRRSRLYVSTSFYEGLPGTCLEAMASNVPSVVWDLPFYRGLVSHGQTGFTVPSGDVEQMADQILSLLGDEDLLVRIGAEARGLVESRYDWSGISKDILRAFEKSCAVF